MINLVKLFQKNDEVYILLLKFAGFITLFGSSYLAYYLRNYTNFYDFLIFFDSIYYFATLVHLVTYLLVISFSKKEKIYKKGFVSFLDIYFKLIFASFLILVFAAIAFKFAENYSRIWFFSNVIFSFLFSLLTKIYFDAKYEKLIKTNRIQRNVLLIGDLESCDEMTKNFNKSKNISIIKGIVPTTNGIPLHGRISTAPLFKLQSDFKKIIDYHHIGQIWIVSSAKSFYKTDDLIDKFSMFAIDCRVVTKDSKYEYEKDISSSEGLEFYDISVSKFYGTGLFVKTFIDKIVSIIILIILFPLILFFAILIIL